MSVHHFTGLLDDSCNAVSVYGEPLVLEDLWTMHIYGFAPVRTTDLSGDVISAFHESLKTVLLLINSVAYTDYLCIRLGDLMHAQEALDQSHQREHRGLDQSTAFNDETVVRSELARFGTFVGVDGNRLLPAFRLGVLRAVEGEAALSVSATLHQFEPAVHTIWLLNVVSRSSDGRKHSNWRAFARCTAVQYEDIAELMYRLSYPALVLPVPDSWQQSSDMAIDQGPVSQPALQTACLRTRTSAMNAQQLLSLDPAKLMGASLLKVAEHYSNTEIYNEVNRRWPGRAFNSLSVLTKRLTAAIETESTRTGRPSKKIRLDLAEIRKDNGVRTRQGL